jgi:hypothetical protein
MRDPGSNKLLRVVGDDAAAQQSRQRFHSSNALVIQSMR